MTTHRIPAWVLQAEGVTLLLTALLFSAGYATPGLVLVLITLIAEAITTKRIPWQRGPLEWFLLGFIVVAFISAILSPHKILALGSTVLAAITIYVTYGSLYRRLRTDSGFLNPFLWAWVIGAISAALWGIAVSRLTGQPAFTAALGKNAVGTTMAVGLILGLGVFLSNRNLRGYAAGIGCAPIGLALILTITRGAWLGAIIGLASLFLLLELRSSWRGLLLLFTICAAGVGLFRVDGLVPTQARAFIDRALMIADPVTYRDRIAMARSAIAIFEDYPVFGTGLNTFSAVYPTYKLPGDRAINQPFAHNVFLNMAAEGGTLGLAFFTGIVLFVIAAGWQSYAHTQNVAATITSATVLSAFIAMMTHALFDNTIMSVHLGAGLWFLAEVLSALKEGSDQTSPTRAQVEAASAGT